MDKFKGRTFLPNVHEFGGPIFGQDPSIVSASGMQGKVSAGALKKVTLTLDGLAVTMTDGTTNGSIGSQQLITFPAIDALVMAARLDLTAIVAAAGIATDADVKFGLGTAAIATDDTMATTEIDIMAVHTATLTASAGTLTGASAGIGVPSTQPVAVDGNAGTSAVHLNIGIADADSTANSTITLTGTVTLFYLDLSAES